MIPYRIYNGSGNSGYMTVRYFLLEISDKTIIITSSLFPVLTISNIRKG